MYTRNTLGAATSPAAMRDEFIAAGYITMAGDVLNVKGLYDYAATRGYSNADIDAAMMTTTRFTQPSAPPPPPAHEYLPSRQEMDPSGEWNAQPGDRYDPANAGGCGAAPSPGLVRVTTAYGAGACRWADTVQAGIAAGIVTLVSSTPSYAAPAPAPAARVIPITPVASPAPAPASSSSIAPSPATSGPVVTEVGIPSGGAGGAVYAAQAFAPVEDYAAEPDGTGGVLYTMTGEPAADRSKMLLYLGAGALALLALRRKR